MYSPHLPIFFLLSLTLGLVVHHINHSLTMHSFLPSFIRSFIQQVFSGGLLCVWSCSRCSLKVMNKTDMVPALSGLMV